MAIEAELASPRWPSSTTASEIEKLLHQADAKVNALRAMAWRLGASGDTSLIAQIAQNPDRAEDQSSTCCAARPTTGELLTVISSLDQIVKRFLAANDEVVKTSELKADIVTNRTVKRSRRRQPN